MNPLQWIVRHPVQATLFIATTWIIGPTAFALWGWQLPFFSPPFFACVLFDALMVALWVVLARRAGVKILIATLTLQGVHGRAQDSADLQAPARPIPALMDPRDLPPIDAGPPRPIGPIQGSGGGLVAGGIVLGGGALAVYCLVRWCRRHFGSPSTNKIPDVATNNTDLVWSSSWIDPGFGYCLSAASLTGPPRTVTIEVETKEEPRMVGLTVSDDIQDVAAFTNLCARLGVPATNGPACSRAGIPVDPALSPVRWDHSGPHIDGAIQGRLQESVDLVAWYDVATLAFPRGRTIIVDQTETPHHFYRVVVP